MNIFYNNNEWLVRIAGIFFFFLFFLLYFFYAAPSGFSSGEVFEIKKGENLSKISEDLYNKKLIRSTSLFNVIVSVLYGEKSVKAGVYYFKEPYSLLDMAKRLTDSSLSTDLIPITILEGQKLDDIAFIFGERFLFKADEFLKLTGFSATDYRGEENLLVQIVDFKNITGHLSDKPAYATLEGYLFPDTYFFPPSILPEDAIRVMLKNLDRKITPEMVKAADRGGRTMFEIITMASLIEKEAFDLEDGKIISGILWKRLDAGMPLQADASILYVIGGKIAGLTLNDLEIDSPYNTYKYAGLPLGPISNPGLDALISAIYPEESPYWYYLHDKNGGAHYAETFEEHKENKAKYLR